MVNYLDSRRIMGTTAERSSIPVPATAGGWVELGRTTLDSNGDIITVSGLPDKRYYKFILRTHPADGNTDDIKLSFNGDSSSNYAYRRSTGGTTDGTFVSTNNFRIDAANGAYDRHVFGYVANYASKEKLVIAHDVIGQTAGATTAPYRIETVGKWANTSNAISSFTFTNQGTGNFASGSEAIILGWDPADTHTNNFWQELASDSPTGSAGESMDVSFTAKKYLWVQWYIDADSPYSFSQMRVGNSTVDSGTNYADRYSLNGAADGTRTSQNKWDLNASTLNAGEQEFGNMFIINNASNEKLMMAWIGGNNTGAGAANAPHRSEWVGKWANTSNQIDTIQMLTNGSDTKTSKSFLKVWGAD